MTNPTKSKSKKKGEPKKECDICGKEHNADSACPHCFNYCADPSYHNGGPCDGSC